MTLYKDFMIENEGYKYYFGTEEVLNVMLENPTIGPQILHAVCSRGLRKSYGRCIKHRLVNAEVANTIMRRAGHFDDLI